MDFEYFENILNGGQTDNGGLFIDANELQKLVDRCKALEESIAERQKQQVQNPIYQTQHYDETSWYDTNKSHYDICSQLDYVKTRVLCIRN